MKKRTTSSRSDPAPAASKSPDVLVSGQPIAFGLKSGSRIAFNKEIARGIYTPPASVPDDHAEEYRKALGTCGVWVNGVLKREMSPAEIGRFPSVRGTADNQPAEQKYHSLAAALDGWFDKPLADLPEDLRNRVEDDPFLGLWGTLIEDHRRTRAAEWDYEHNPALEAKRRRDWDEYVAGWEEHWQKVSLLTAAEFCILRRVHDPRNFDDERSYIPEGESKPLGELVADDLRIIGRGANRSGTKPLAEWISIAGQSGLKVPEYLRGAGEEGGEATTKEDQADTGDKQPAGAAPECADFRSMKSLTAGELVIAFVADGRLLEITARGVTRRVPLANLDLEDRRNGSMNFQCGILLGIAKEKRILYTPTKSQTILRLRRAFKNHLGVGNPFDAYRKVAGWEARFTVVDKRNAADERAKREGVRRTVSFEGMEEHGTQFQNTSQDSEHEGNEEEELDKLITDQRRDQDQDRDRQS